MVWLVFFRIFSEPKLPFFDFHLDSFLDDLFGDVLNTLCRLAVMWWVVVWYLQLTDLLLVAGD